MVTLSVESEIEAIVEKAIDKYGKRHDALIPILSEVNQKLGYIPEQLRDNSRLKMDISHNFMSGLVQCRTCLIG
jgi:hypothetical protein